MAVIYMKHPIHGAKVATMELEALADEENGWVRYTLDTPSEPEAAPEQEVKKRGRKPTKSEQPVANDVPDFLAPQADKGE